MLSPKEDMDALDRIFDFLVDNKMAPQFENRYEIGITKKENTTLSSLFALKQSYSDKKKGHFREILISNFAKFKSCGAICLYINLNPNSYHSRDRMKKVISNLEYCNYKDDYLRI